MPVETSPKTKVEDFATGFRSRLNKIDSQFSYLCFPSMPEEDVKPYLHEPIAALPPAIRKLLPHIAIFLVPYLESGKNGVRVSETRVPLPDEARSHVITGKDSITFLFAVKDEEVSEYHYTLYNELAALVARSWPDDVRDTFLGVVRGELAAKVSGEIDEKSWTLKQALQRRSGASEKVLKEYARQAFEDTLTLYLHGICCDIDVETGPRQMPGRFVRKRLEVLHTLFPPPAGHAVFPEQLNRAIPERASR